MKIKLNSLTQCLAHKKFPTNGNRYNHLRFVDNSPMRAVQHADNCNGHGLLRTWDQNDLWGVSISSTPGWLG